MPSFLRFEVHFLSFWLGFIIASLFWWIILLIRSQWPTLKKALKAQVQAMRESLTASTETRLRGDTLRSTMAMHIAAPLFPLDEILVEPRVILPPPLPVDDETEGNIYTQVLPYLPDWPELPAAFSAPNTTLSTALQGGANLILMGNPGSGKTVALAHLASAIARKDPKIGELAEFVPILIQASNISPEMLESKPPLGVLVEIVSSQVSTLTLTRLPNLIENALETGEALILLDGLDELPPASTRQIARWAGELVQQYPNVRWVAATSPDDHGGLTQLGMVPISIAVWNHQQRAEFIEKWRHNWLHSMIPAEQVDAAEIDTLLLNNWLLAKDISLNPLEFTLKVWSAYAGDALGPEATNTVESYLRRMTVDIPKARTALQSLAQQMIDNLSPICLQRDAENWLAAYEQVSVTSDEVTTKSSKPVSSRIVLQLLESGILVNRPGGWISFSHPILLGYLAGSAFANTGITSIRNQPNWSGKALALAYTAAFGDLTELANELLASKEDPLQRNNLLPLQWLRLAPKETPWRATALRSTITHLQKENFCLNFGARALIALVLTKESGLAAMFRQWLESDNALMRYLAILGCGLTEDTKAINNLANKLETESIPILSQAACLALSVIPDETARDAIITGLLHGNESTRNAAAEILANDPDEGAQILQEASQMEDLLVRRAAVYGLKNVHEDWALELLEKIAVEDGQWLVRNAAAQALEEKKQSSTQKVKALPALHETPWLISYAAEQGMGVSPGKPALELLLQALREGNDEQKLRALDYLRLHGNEDNIVQLYNLFYASEGEVHEISYNALWHISASGITLPPPVQFGLG